MIYVWFTAALLIVGGLLAAAIVRERKKHDSAIGRMRERERALAERLVRVETALSEKATAAESRNIAMMVHGVASICRRQEDRLAALESEGRDSQPGAAGD